MPLGEFMDWHPHDRDTAVALRSWHAEECGDCGVHPSVWKPALGGHRNAVVARWEFCRVCETIDQAKDAGPPTRGETTHGWRLRLTNTNAHTKEATAHG